MGMSVGCCCGPLRGALQALLPTYSVRFCEAVVGAMCRVSYVCRRCAACVWMGAPTPTKLSLWNLASFGARR